MIRPLEALQSEVQLSYNAVPDDLRSTTWAGHWWDHVSRVVRNAAVILDEEAIQDARAVVLAAAFCHDLAVDVPTDSQVMTSAVRCYELMVQCGFDGPDAELGKRLVEATDRDVRRPTTTLEGILYVADKLDLFGYDGTVRLLLEEGRKGPSVRDELLIRVRERQADWLRFMTSLGVGRGLMLRRVEETNVLLRSLEPVPDVQLRPGA